MCWLPCALLVMAAALRCQCLVYYEYCFPETDAQQAEVDRLRVDCLLNLASCKLRTRQFDEVVNNCSQVGTGCEGCVCALGFVPQNMYVTFECRRWTWNPAA